jgi:hypothetical protein
VRQCAGAAFAIAPELNQHHERMSVSANACPRFEPVPRHLWTRGQRNGRFPVLSFIPYGTPMGI